MNQLIGPGAGNMKPCAPCHCPSGGFVLRWAVQLEKRMEKPARPTTPQVNLHLDLNSRPIKTITQIYEGLIAEGTPPETLRRLRQLAEMERDANVGPAGAALHERYKTVRAQQFCLPLDRVE